MPGFGNPTRVSISIAYVREHHLGNGAVKKKS
jgi:hypothetical protein